VRKTPSDAIATEALAVVATANAARPDDPPAVRLAVAITRLRRRLRDIDRKGLVQLPLSQLSIVHYLQREGPATASTLAAAQHVSQQAIAQSLATLKSAGLVAATADPGDKRKSLIHATDAGRAVVETVLASRTAWLVKSVDQTVGADERDTLEQAIDLLERLADAD
jgi:DNA-binding MarR family transcriptional regulator